MESIETVKKPIIVETPDAEEAVETTTAVQAKSDLKNGMKRQIRKIQTFFGSPCGKTSCDLNIYNCL